MPRYYGITIYLALAVILSGCSSSLSGDITPPPGSELPAPQATNQPVITNTVYPIVPPDVTTGKVLYNQNCVQCHGVKGLGDGPQVAQLSVPAAELGLSDFARQFSPAEWYNVVSQGDLEKFMPAFPNLTARQRWDVVAYAMSLSASDKAISQGKALYESNCKGCHGPAGNGHGANASTLNTTPAAFTDQSFMAQTSSANLYDVIASGISPDMPAYTSTMDDSQRWTLVSYIRSLTYSASSTTENAYPYPAPPDNSSSQATLTSSSQAAEVAITQSPTITSTADVTSTATFTGSVTVQLVNGSGGDAPSESTVTLYGFDNMQNTYSGTLTTGENGVYTFTNVTMPAGRVFLAGTQYASGSYVSDIATVDPTTPNLSLPITVYDSTTDVSVLTTDRLHVFFDFTDPQNVQVIEVFIISNPTKQSVVSASTDGTVVSFPLPQGYTNLQFDNGELGARYVELSQGFGDTTTVIPGVGQYQVVFTYQLPYSHRLNFVQAMFLPTSAVVVMLPDNGIKLSSSMLQDGGTTDYKGITYRIYNGNSINAGSSVDLTLTGSPRQAAASILAPGSMQNLAIGLGVFGVALVALGLWLYQRNRQKLALQKIAESTQFSDSYSDLGFSPEDEDTLMDAIIALDDQFHAGNLPEAAYLERRAALKEKLRKMEQG